MAEAPERLWVPRLCVVSDDRELIAGTMAGILLRAEALRHSTVGRAMHLTDLRHTIWLVERSELDDGIIDEQAIVLADKLIDRERQPHAQRWLQGLPLVCVSGLKWQRIVDQDKLRIHRVAVDERHGRVSLAVEAAGGGRPPWSFEADLGQLEAAARAAGEGPRQGMLRPVSSLCDRLLRRLSRDVLSEEAVVAAWQAAELVEPGYGYRGAPDGSPASIERIERNVRALEVVFAQIDARAERQRERAEEIALALRQGKDAEGEEISLPVYGRAERFGEEEVPLALGEEASYQLAGEAKSELVLPGYPRWFVAAFEPWEPTLPAELARELEREQERKPPSQWAVLVAVLVLAAIAAVSLALRAR